MVQSQKPFKIQSNFQCAGDQAAAVSCLTKGLEAGLQAQTLLGVTGSGKTFAIANVIERTQRPTLVMAHNKTLAAQLYGEFREFFPDNAVEYFVSYYDYYQPEAYVAASDTYIEKDSSINEHIEQMRLSATKAVIQRRDTIIVSTVSSIYGLGDPSSYLEMVIHLDRGEAIGQRQLIRRLAEMQYTRNDQILQRGTYRVRGETIDIFPAESESYALRVELFDEEIEALALFDPLTGVVQQPIPRFTIFPKTHYVTPQERLQKATGAIRIELGERLADLNRANLLVEAQRLEQRTRYDLEMIEQLGYCSGIENYSRYLSKRKAGEPPPTLFDYMPADSLIVVDESHATVPQILAMYKGDRSRKENLVNYGFRLPSALDNRPLRFDEWEEIVGQLIFVSATPGTYEGEHSQQTAELIVRPTGLVDPEIIIRPATSQVDDLLSEIKLATEAGERVLVTTLTKRMAEDLTDYLDEHGVRVRYLHSDVETVERVEIIRDLRIGAFDVLVGINLLREGLDMPEVALVAILDADKEGFLRSERSLIQTMGRAARNVNGRAILYADQETGSMRRAISETDRRREKQRAHNLKYNITPEGIHKNVLDIMDGARIPGRKGTALSTRGGRGSHDRRRGRSSQAAAQYDTPRTVNEAAKLLSDLEAQMNRYAKNLEFEEAAQIRDQITMIKKQLLMEDV